MNCNIGFYKYETSKDKNFNFIDYYPINEEVKNYLSSSGNIKYEFENNSPKIIDGKLVILI